MSDLYLELRTRIPVVTDWVAVGAERLAEAQKARGLSNERLAREIPVSTKTWERWKKRGELPADSIPAVAKALNLEIKRPGGEPLALELPSLDGATAGLAGDALAELLVEAKAMGDAGREVAAALRELRALLAQQKAIVDRLEQLEARGG